MKSSPLTGQTENLLLYLENYMYKVYYEKHHSLPLNEVDMQGAFPGENIPGQII